MSVGLGIFLGCVFIGAVLLYLRTKQSWNWKKIVVYPVAFILVAGLATWGWVVYSNRPKPQTTLWGVRLGETINDVRFKKGTPRERDSGSYKGITWIRVTYGADNSTDVRIRFVEDRVQGVTLYSFSSNYIESIGGIYFGNGAERIVEKFGEPPTRMESDDALRRVYAFPRYHVFFGLNQNKVVAMGIYDPNGPVPITLRKENDPERTPR